MSEPSINPDKVAEALLAFAEEELDWPSFGSFVNYYDIIPGQTSYDVPNLGKVTMVDYHDYDHNKNYDSWTEHMWIVFDVNGILYRARGTYTSYIGAEWEDELKIVVPTPKTIIEYKEVQ